MSDVRASLLIIGDEILGGFVQDTNSGWLAGRLQDLGVPLDWVHTLPDTLEAIAEALTTELGRARPRLIMTSGGIGSTPDDLTMEGVARTLGRGLAVEPHIDERITRALEWTAGRGITVTEAHERAMRKMALVPEGAYLLPGASGLLPGVAVDVDGGLGEGGATIVIFPGVPAELRRIMSEGVEPSLLAGRGAPQHVVEVHHPFPESMLAATLDEIVAEHPEVHLGSYPGEDVTIRLKGPRAAVEAAAEVVRAVVAELETEPGAARLAAEWRARRGS